MEQAKTTKKCAKCGRELPLGQFNACKRNSDGLQCHCKECQSKYNIERTERFKASRFQFATETKSPEDVLKQFTPRQLMQELKRRGYDGELIYVQRIKLSAI